MHAGLHRAAGCAALFWHEIQGEVKLICFEAWPKQTLAELKTTWNTQVWSAAS